MIDPKKAEAWLAFLTDDAAKVDFMKAAVEAEAATERIRIAERAQVQRHDISEGRHVVRGVWACVVLTVLGGGTCAWDDVQKARLDVDRCTHADAGAR